MRRHPSFFHKLLIIRVIYFAVRCDKPQGG